MISRRKFIQHSSALALGTWAVASSADAWATPALSRPVGVQLFTFFGQLDNDLTGILKKLSELGYETVESAFSMKGGFYGLKAQRICKDYKGPGIGMEVASRARHSVYSTSRR